jgi:hypothetical protein
MSEPEQEWGGGDGELNDAWVKTHCAICESKLESYTANVNGEPKTYHNLCPKCDGGVQ